MTQRLGARLDTAPRSPVPLPELVSLAVRRNPRRAHLLVSGGLGKHVPADPRLVHESGLRLGALVRDELGGASAVVLGFAETATGLGHCVAEALAAPCLHSTRRHVATAPALATFEEEHSHATGHRLLPEDPGLLGRGDVLVLVDDELSTGRTAMNTITALHAVAEHRRYVVASLVDLRTAADRAALTAFAAGLGIRVDVVALATGSVHLPAGFAVRAAELVAHGQPEPTGPATLGEVVFRPARWPVGVREGGRHGFHPYDLIPARSAAAAVADELAPVLRGRRVLVLGTEELMYAPLLIALQLADRGVAVRMSSTTRSPVFVVDAPGYPIRDALTFAAVDGTDGGPRHAYNTAGFDDVVLVIDAELPPDAGVLTALRGVAARVHVVPLPCHSPLPEPLRGPHFGSYATDDAGWLLTDLSGVTLEAPVEEREEAVQSGGAHYAESLPIEYQPDAAYQLLFDRALDAAAERIAHAVGVVTEIVLAERGPDVVLASLARAGTPVGVLMRRWAQLAHGRDLSHYAVSIVRGRGIDTVALRFLAARHNPRDVVFVDGWTGKGAIARELAAAVATANELLGTAFDPALTVLADPGSCVRTFGTREDFLVPSACLNSTVSGLVSRTVLNPAILAPGQFHGAKFYRELAAVDVSHRFLDAVTARFADVAARVADEWPVAARADRRPTFVGWAEVERLSREYGIDDVTLVKPGVGETTRVLLRRVPWLVLVRAGEPDSDDGLAHLRLLAGQRGVPVQEEPCLAYRAVGLIHPRFTRGATGRDGRSAGK